MSGAAGDGGGNLTWHEGEVVAADRPTLGATVWLTGLSGSGKSTVAVALERLLVGEGRPAYRLDGDHLRHGLNADLGFRWSTGTRTSVGPANRPALRRGRRGGRGG